MSQAIPHTPAPGVLRLHWRAAVALLALVLVAAAVTIYVVSSGDEPASAPAVHSTSTSGPNEALRGQAAASSAGAVASPGAGGPNETLRGNAARDATSGR